MLAVTSQPLIFKTATSQSQHIVHLDKNKDYYLFIFIVKLICSIIIFDYVLKKVMLMYLLKTINVASF